MKVALVTLFPRDPARVGGGVSGAAKHLADRLAGTPGVELTVVVPQGGPGPDRRETRDGMTVIRAGKSGPWSFLPGTLYDLAAGRRQVNAILAGIGPDIVHYQGLSLLAAACPYPSVLTVHGLVERDAWIDRPWGPLWPLRWLLLKLTEARARDRAENVILVSDYAGSLLPGTRRTWRINNPISDSFFDAAPRPEAGRVLCSGRVQPLKNILGLVEAVALAAETVPAVELRVAGKGDAAYRARCESRARELGVADRIKFLGNLGAAELRSELERAACVALVSFQENAPLAIAEAMAAGAPVVASNVGGIPEMVSEGGTGLLVDPRNPGEIAAALAFVLTHPGEARSMGRTARGLASERYRAEAVVRATLRVYSEILGREEVGA